MNFILFCKKYFKATGLPISLLNKSIPEYSTIGEVLQYTSAEHFPLYPQQQNPNIERLTPDLEYGHIAVEGTDYDIILGPVFTVPATDELIRLFMREQMIPVKFKEQLSDFLFSMPTTSHLQLLRHLAFIHLCLNQKDSNIDAVYDFDTQQPLKQNVSHIHDRVEYLENAYLRNTYTFEIGLYECIKDGNETKLIEYMNMNAIPLWEGKTASSPLRHAKNIFISTVQKAGLIGAIPGGVEIEATYHLMDHYIQECEKMQDIESISNLRHAMLLDFCRRAGESHVPEGLSADIFLCMNYIRTHTNEPLTISDVAKQIGRSPSYVMKKFKKELDIHVGTYITRCKMEEAKSMLIFTEKSLAEISSYLCFSSQSYFHNIFKKQYGITPTQCRQRGQRI